MAHGSEHILRRDDLIASYYTISGAEVMKPAAPFLRTARAAVATAGFAGIGWTPMTTTRAAPRDCQTRTCWRF